MAKERGKNVGRCSRIPKGHDRVAVIERVYRVTARGFLFWLDGGGGGDK
jgi:hypothetical protein